MISTVQNQSIQKQAVNSNSNAVAKKNDQLPDIGKTMVQRMVSQVAAFANIENTPLTDKEKAYAAEIVMGVIQKVEEAKVDWHTVDVKNVVSQVKRYARLGLSISENELYIDMRNNGKTGMKEINIKKQYQGVEKELVRWCDKKIIRFYKDVICEGDEFESEVDFETGLEKVVKHIKNKNIDRNKLENITGAYDIAYVEENGKLVQYPVVIDKNRIMRAYNASPTNEKPVWKNDTKRMVLKTAVWCLYSYVLKPFMNIPIELKKDWEETQDQMNFNNVEEAVYEEIQTNANTGEVIDIVEHTQQFETPQTPVQEQKQPEQQVEQQSLFAEQKAAMNNSGRPF